MRRYVQLVFALMSALLLAMTVNAQRANPAGADGLLRAASDTAVVDGDLKAAIKQYQTIVDTFRADRAVVATALIRMADCYQKLGDAEARRIYEEVVRNYDDQVAAAGQARTRLAAIESAATSPTKNTAHKVWSGGNFTGDAAPSPDGRYLSFTSSTGDVAIRDLTTNTERPATKGADWVSEYSTASVISPDGRQVAYTWYIHKENTVDLRVVSIASRDIVQPQIVLRSELGAAVYKTAWMPDGKRLVVVRLQSDRTSQIGIVAIQDGSFRSLKSLEWRKPNVLSVSGDGRYVAYDTPASENGSPRDIVVLATDGSRETTVVRDPADDSFPFWSPDGSRLVFLSNRTGSNALWVMPIDDGRSAGPAASIKSDVGAVTPLGMSRTGTLYYFSRTGTSPRNLYAAGLDDFRVTTPPARATERLINTNIGPTWSQDGEYLAYYSFRDPSTGMLVIRSAKTGEERTVPLPMRVTTRFQAGPKWFPDNRTVLVESGDAQGSGFGFYRLDVSTGNTELLTHIAREVTSYDLSRDGRMIVYAIITDSADKLMRFDIDGRRETELRSVGTAAGTPETFGLPGSLVSLAISPDGSRLATRYTGGVLAVMPSTGGPLREIFRPASHEMGTGSMRQAVAWTPDQKFILFVRGDGTFWRVPAQGGDAEKVGLSMGYIKNPAVRPDGKQIVFDAGSGGTAEIWALENLVPPVRTAR